MNERQSLIVEYIAEHGKTEVSVLAKYFKVSCATMRKDLQFLADSGVLRRERGFALPSLPEDIHYHMAFHFRQKQRIAQAAADLVGEGETILVESSSTCALFAEAVAKKRRHVTIVTNSLYLSNYVRGYSSVQLVLLGGTLQTQSQSLVGPLTKAAVQSFHVSKMFTGIDGYTRDYGFTGDDLNRVDTLRTMCHAASEIIVLAESDKFHHTGAVSYLSFGEVYGIVTDDGLPEEERVFLQQKGLSVNLVPSKN